MEKSKRILIVLIILLIVMAVMVAILINTNKKQEVSHGNNTYTSIVNVSPAFTVSVFGSNKALPAIEPCLVVPPSSLNIVNA